MVENDPPDVRKKTTRRFYKSDPSFLIKQAVVFTKVTRRFFFALFLVRKNPLFGAEKFPFRCRKISFLASSKVG